MLALADEQRYRGTYEIARRSSQETDSSGAVPWRLFVLLAMVAMIALAFVWLRSSIQQVSRDLQIQQRKMALHSEELDNLFIQAEAYRSGDYILTECRKLGLHPPLPGQVRRISLSDQAPATSPEHPPSLAASALQDEAAARRTP